MVGGKLESYVKYRNISNWKYICKMDDNVIHIYLEFWLIFANDMHTLKIIILQPSALWMFLQMKVFFRIDLLKN